MCVTVCVKFTRCCKLSTSESFNISSVHIARISIRVSGRTPQIESNQVKPMLKQSEICRVKQEAIDRTERVGQYQARQNDTDRPTQILEAEEVFKLNNRIDRYTLSLIILSHALLITKRSHSITGNTDSISWVHSQTSNNENYTPTSSDSRSASVSPSTML